MQRTERADWVNDLSVFSSFIFCRTKLNSKNVGSHCMIYSLIPKFLYTGCRKVWSAIGRQEAGSKQ